MSASELVKEFSLKNILKKLSENRFIWIFSFSVLTAVSAQFTVPVKPVPFTLQTMAVLLSGAFLGSRKGALSQVIYLALGILGLPVFAQTPGGAIGFERLIGPTGGYLLAFPIAAFITGFLIEMNKSYVIVVSSMFIGSLIIIVMGALFLNTFFIRDFSEAVKAGAAIFSVWTVIKVFAAATIYFGITKKNIKKSKT